MLTGNVLCHMILFHISMQFIKDISLKQNHFMVNKSQKVKNLFSSHLKLVL